MNFEPVYPKETNSILNFKELFIDVGHKNDGYFYAWADIKDKNKKLKLRVTKGNKIYNYDLNRNREKEVFPFQFGNGTYVITLLQNRVGKLYRSLGALSVYVELENEFSPFLCPSQYVNYTENSEVLEKAKELCGNLTDDVKKIEALRTFIKKGFVYDYVRAITIAENYLGDAQKCFDTRIGLCLDFSVLFAAMTRSLGIPTKLIIGHAGLSYHAWNEVYLNGAWETIDTTADITGNKAKRYRAERFY